ncbi:MAG: transaldolase [Nitrosomonas sp.]|nr:transaldolase [Nitrosomonas sp.]
MNATEQLHNLGQSLWLDNITRRLLTSGTLARYINEFSVTGLTSNPTIFEHAILNTDYYDEAIRQKVLTGKSGEALFFELALEDLTQAADLFLAIHQNTNRIDGWVSLELSPLLANDTIGTVKAAAQRYAQAQRPNFFIKIPGTSAGIPAIEESIFMGIPINVTLLFSREHYIAAAEAYMRGIERRIAAGLPPVASVASIFVSRWDVAAKNIMKSDFIGNHLGIAMATRIYRAYHDLLASKRWQKLALSGAQPQRLLWGSTGTKDPSASDTLYIEALAAPGTINTMPEKTLLAFAEHGKIKNMLSIDNDSAEKAEAIIAEFNQQGVNDEELAAQLQREGTTSFATSWDNLMKCIASKSDAVMHNS